MTKVFDLVLSYRWYDMITKGQKREEYRRICPNWENRLRRFAAGDIVRFRRGYSSVYKDNRIVNITTGYGLTEWGAPPEVVYIIKFDQL